MTTFFAGDVVTAAQLEALTADPFNFVSSTSDSGTITNTESVALTLPSKTYKAGKAYRVWIGGGVTYSVSTGAFSSWNIKRGTTTAGATVISYPRQTNGASTNLEVHVNLQHVFIVGASDVTTQLVLAVACNSTNTLVHKGSTTGNTRHVTILRAGDAANWSGMPVLS